MDITGLILDFEQTEEFILKFLIIDRTAEKLIGQYAIWLVVQIIRKMFSTW